jgi:hypothetical protein
VFAANANRKTAENFNFVENLPILHNNRKYVFVIRVATWKLEFSVFNNFLFLNLKHFNCRFMAQHFIDSNTVETSKVTDNSEHNYTTKICQRMHFNSIHFITEKKNLKFPLTHSSLL